MSAHSRHTHSQTGFTLLELVTAITLMAVLVMLAMYPLQEWQRNNQVRSTADSLQNGLRQAQAEALRRSRTVIFFLTDSADFAAQDTGSATPASLVSVASEAASGGRVKAKNWGLFTTQRGDNTPAQFIEAGLSSSKIEILGPKAICFNSIGRLVTRTAADTKVGDAACTSGDIPATYDVRIDDSTRNLRLTVSVGGQVRMCDPNKEDGLDACPRT